MSRDFHRLVYDEFFAKHTRPTGGEPGVVDFNYFYYLPSYDGPGNAMCGRSVAFA